MSSLVNLPADTHYGFLDEHTKAPKLNNPRLISNEPGETMLSAISLQLAEADSFLFSVAFITADGLAALKQKLAEFPGPGTIITSNYLGFNEPDAFRELLEIPGVKTFIHEDSDAGFHAKGYLFRTAKITTAIVGSSNMTVNALNVNQEWNVQFSTADDGDIANQLENAVQRQIADSTPLTQEWIEEYESIRRKRVIEVRGDQPIIDPYGAKRIEPNPMQSEALAGLTELYNAGERRGLIISATGTGKTILAALAVRSRQPKRMLFVAHTEQILRKAAAEFKLVLGIDDAGIGLLSGNEQHVDAQYLFATVQSLSRPYNLAKLHRDAFDYIIIDEVHRSGAESYRKIIDYFTPSFLLGLTATPERTDGFDIFELFDWNVPYEIRLQTALEAKMLVPFHYYGISDYAWISDNSTLEERLADERIDFIVQNLQIYGFPRGVKGLIFCSSNEESVLLSEKLNRRKVHGRTLRTRSLSGADSIEKREDAIAELTAGKIDYLVTVNIFNEGIDIPALNQIVMMRGTESSIIFTQQLGRGLRKHKGKDHLRVLDFIGNYENSYLIPVALSGDGSGNKDALREIVTKGETPALPPTSSVNFDQISSQRILDTLSKVKFDNPKLLREAVNTVKMRLGRVPALSDIFRFETTNPITLAQKWDNYWTFLAKYKYVDIFPTEQEAQFLNILSKEILNGLRPHELILLRELLEHERIDFPRFAQAARQYGVSEDEATLESAIRVLDLSFLKKPLRTYGTEPVVMRSGEQITLNPEFKNLYAAYSNEDEFSGASFSQHVDDIISTGLAINRKEYGKASTLVIGKRYTRKDVSRLLNWKQNEESTMYGYKYDVTTSTMPIFVTYHKDGDTQASVRYDDRFLDSSTMAWKSKNNRTLASSDVRTIVQNSLDMHLFVKRDDSEGLGFFYLGEVQSTDAEEDHMLGDEGESIDVVNVTLKLESPVEAHLYRYLEDSGTIKPKSSSAT